MINRHTLARIAFAAALVCFTRAAGLAKDPAPVTISVLDADGKVIAALEPTAESLAAKVRLKRKYRPGDRIVVTGPQHLAVKLDTAMPAHMVYCPTGKLSFAVPTGRALSAYSPKYFRAEQHTISARAIKIDEAAKYRNLAVNIYDTLKAAGSYPHASCSNYYKTSANNGLPAYEPRNAIDGETKAGRHGGWPWQSWGPEQRKDLWFRIDFGRPVEIDKIGIVVRAQFPPYDKGFHDDVFQGVTAVFSDGSTAKIKLKRTADVQEFRFAKRTVRWVKLTDLVLPEARRWAGFVEVQAWGKDAPKKPNKPNKPQKPKKTGKE